MSKKRAFVKYTKAGDLIPGSLIVTTTGGYPVDGLYKEVDVFFNDTVCPPVGLTYQYWRYDGPNPNQTVQGTVYGGGLGCGDLDFAPGDVMCVLFFCNGGPGPDFTNLGSCQP
jgi:hypothetical protein